MSSYDDERRGGKGRRNDDGRRFLAKLSGDSVVTLLGLAIGAIVYIVTDHALIVGHTKAFEKLQEQIDKRFTKADEDLDKAQTKNEHQFEVLGAKLDGKADRTPVVIWRPPPGTPAPTYEEMLENEHELLTGKKK